MLLLPAIVAGMLFGFGLARRDQVKYQVPVLRHVWLVVIAFLPQYITIQLSVQQLISQRFFAILLVTSQILFVIFAFLNRNFFGMKVLILGAVLNLLVMIANQGFMPIGPLTAEKLIPNDFSLQIYPGDRFGAKDRVLLPEETRFEWLADRFLTPAWFPYQSAFSLGDIFIAAGVFVLLTKQENKKVKTHDRSNYVSTVIRQS